MSPQCRCEHWQICPVCYPQGFDADGNLLPPEPTPLQAERTQIEKDEALLWQALEALEESVDLVRHDYASNWRHGVPTRERQLAGLKEQLDQHEATITALRERLGANDAKAD